VAKGYGCDLDIHGLFLFLFLSATIAVSPRTVRASERTDERTNERTNERASELVGKHLKLLTGTRLQLGSSFFYTSPYYHYYYYHYYYYYLLFALLSLIEIEPHERTNGREGRRVYCYCYVTWGWIRLAITASIDIYTA